jgi:uncharacterized protein YndB with AHSA1/START domain
MNRQISPGPVHKTVTVNAGIEQAFDVFARGMGRWWLRSHSINRGAAQTDVIIEPKPHGRWYEVGADGSECQWGHVIDWSPPERLLLAWQMNANWQYDPTFLTEVEVRFTSEGPSATRIDLEHRMLERFGDAAEKARASFDSEGGWAGLLAAYSLAV